MLVKCGIRTCMVFSCLVRYISCITHKKPSNITCLFHGHGWVGNTSIISHQFYYTHPIGSAARPHIPLTHALYIVAYNNQWSYRNCLECLRMLHIKYFIKGQQHTMHFKYWLHFLSLALPAVHSYKSKNTYAETIN